MRPLTLAAGGAHVLFPRSKAPLRVMRGPRVESGARRGGGVGSWASVYLNVSGSGLLAPLAALFRSSIQPALSAQGDTVPPVNRASDDADDGEASNRDRSYIEEMEDAVQNLPRLEEPYAPVVRCPALPTNSNCESQSPKEPKSKRR